MPRWAAVGGLPLFGRLIKKDRLLHRCGEICPCNLPPQILAFFKIYQAQPKQTVGPSVVFSKEAIPRLASACRGDCDEYFCKISHEAFLVR